MKFRAGDQISVKGKVISVGNKHVEIQVPPLLKSFMIDKNDVSFIERPVKVNDTVIYHNALKADVLAINEDHVWLRPVSFPHNPFTHPLRSCEVINPKD